MLGKTEMTITSETVVLALQNYIDEIMPNYPQRVTSVKREPNSYDDKKFLVTLEAPEEKAPA